MDSNNNNRNNDSEEQQPQFEKTGQRPGYDDDNSHKLRAGSSEHSNSDSHDDLKSPNAPDHLQDIEDRWNEINEEYRRRYPNLTSDDVDYRAGEFDNMTDRIAQRTNRSREDVQDEIRNWNS